MARARLRDRHQHNLRRKLQLLKQEQGVAHAQGAERRSQSPAAPEQPAPAAEADAGDSDASASGAEAAAACEALYVGGRYSPTPLPPAALEPGTLLCEAADDEQRLAYLRARLLAAAPPGRRQPRAFADDAPFATEHALPDQPCLWADKYRPRKPRYFNRHVSSTFFSAVSLPSSCRSPARFERGLFPILSILFPPSMRFVVLGARQTWIFDLQFEIYQILLFLA